MHFVTSSAGAKKPRRIIVEAYPELFPINNSETDYMLRDKTRVRLAYMDTQEGEFPSYITQGPKYDRLILVIDNNGDRLRLNIPYKDVKPFIRLLSE
jgi:hypothetical protein